MVHITARTTKACNREDIVTIKERLNYIRQQIYNENISYSELAELQSLSAHIHPNDVVLREWAGVEELEV